VSRVNFRKSYPDIIIWTFLIQTINLEVADWLIDWLNLRTCLFHAIKFVWVRTWVDSVSWMDDDWKFEWHKNLQWINFYVQERGGKPNTNDHIWCCLSVLGYLCESSLLQFKWNNRDLQEMFDKQPTANLSIFNRWCNKLYKVPEKNNIIDHITWQNTNSINTCPLSQTLCLWEGPPPNVCERGHILTLFQERHIMSCQIPGFQYRLQWQLCRRKLQLPGMNTTNQWLTSFRTSY